jgi:RHS repeat-associated protein
MLSRTAGGTSTSYTYQGTGEDAAKIQVGVSTPVYYDFTASGPLAQRTGTDSASLRYYLRDLHGDVVAAAATSGTNRVKGSILYSPWGQAGARTGEMSTSPTQGYLGFQGDLTDSSTGHVDMLTRYYEPTLGRFTRRDVLFGDMTEPASLNQLVYAQDAPVTYWDPTGMHVAASASGGGTCIRACEADAQQAAANVAAGLDPHAASPAVEEPEPVRPITYNAARIALAAAVNYHPIAGCARRCGEYATDWQPQAESTTDNGCGNFGFHCWDDALKQGAGAVNRVVSDRIASSYVGQVLQLGASLSHRTLGLCSGGSAYLPLAEVTGSGCYQVTPSGEHGLTATLGEGTGEGFGANATIGLSVSNAESVQKFGGKFDYVDASAGEHVAGAGVDYAWSTTHGDTTWQSTISWSPGFRSNWFVAGFRGVSYTWTP